MPSAATARRPRRVDPDRKARIADAAIDVIAEAGVAGLSARRVAAAADVPLGSVTYHFESVGDLLREAFQRHAERGAAAYAAAFDGVRGPADLPGAVAAMVCDSVGDERGWAITYELYVAAQRDPALRAITERWMRASRTTLGAWLDEDAARGLDALLNGLVVQQGLATDPIDRDRVRGLVAAHLAA